MSNKVTTPQPLVCEKCGSNNVNVQVTNEHISVGCLGAIGYLILFCIPIIGWIALFHLIVRRRNKSRDFVVCQNCGHKKDLTRIEDRKKNFINLLIGLVLLIIIAVAIYYQTKNI
jgi:Ca2+/Na+ antiporter